MAGVGGDLDRRRFAGGGDNVGDDEVEPVDQFVHPDQLTGLFGHLASDSSRLRLAGFPASAGQLPLAPWVAGQQHPESAVGEPA
jgi:hypothetical protein